MEGETKGGRYYPEREGVVGGSRERKGRERGT